jgi:hypothetical protein
MSDTDDDDAPPSWQCDLYELFPALIGRHEDFLFVTGLAGTSRDIGARLIREGNGTAFVLIRVATSPPPKYKRNLDPSSCRDRFRAALLG